MQLPSCTFVLRCRTSERNVHTPSAGRNALRKPMGHQLPDPLAVQHIGLAPRHLARRSRIHQMYLESASVQNFIQRDPVHPRASIATWRTPNPSSQSARPRNSSLNPPKRRTDSSAASGRTATQCSSLPIDPRAVRINDIQPLLAHTLACHAHSSQHPNGCAGNTAAKVHLSYEVTAHAVPQRLHADAVRATLFDGCDHTSEEPASSLRTRQTAASHVCYATARHGTWGENSLTTQREVTRPKGRNASALEKQRQATSDKRQATSDKRQATSKDRGRSPLPQQPGATSDQLKAADQSGPTRFGKSGPPPRRPRRPNSSWCP